MMLRFPDLSGHVASRAYVIDMQTTVIRGWSSFRIYLVAWTLLSMAHSASRAQTSPTPDAAKPPNIVFVLTDDMGYSDLTCYGGNFAPTPNLDRLAKEGVRFTHFYDNAPICSASRCAFITGMFPARWNFTTFLSTRAMNLDCEQADFLPPSAQVLARTLKAAGYTTGHFGKWHLGGGSGASKSETERLLFEIKGNHQSRQVIRLSHPVTTDCLELRLLAPTANAPAALFEVRCYAT